MMTASLHMVVDGGEFKPVVDDCDVETPHQLRNMVEGMRMGMQVVGAVGFFAEGTDLRLKFELREPSETSRLR